MKMRHALFGDMDQHVRIYGSNVFSLDGKMGPMHVIAISTARPTTAGHCVNYSIALTKKDGTDEEIAGRLDMMEAFARELVKDDKPIMSTIRVRPAALTRSDFGLRRYFAYARDFPRNSEAMPYIAVQ
jgi:hypothetical protein